MKRFLMLCLIVGLVFPAARLAWGQSTKTLTNSIGMKFVLIPAGTFQMGSLDAPGQFDQPGQHQVTISNPFYLQTTEVTLSHWGKVMVKDWLDWVGLKLQTLMIGKMPVQMITWKEAQEFIQELNRMEETDKYRLPTEAEWEYACRAGSTTRFSFGDDTAKLSQYGWYYDNSFGGFSPMEFIKFFLTPTHYTTPPKPKAHPVGQLKPNAWGLYDMHGNVGEYCQDWFSKYPAGPVTDPEGPVSGDYRVVRGGSYGHSAEATASAVRSKDPLKRYCPIGFRVARDY